MANIKQNQHPRDENGDPHGEWIKHYSNGRLSYRENWVHGLINGLSERYDENGKLRHRGCQNMGIRFGYWYLYNEKYYYLCLI